jgi:hypothetical protein
MIIALSVEVIEFIVKKEMKMVQNVAALMAFSKVKRKNAKNAQKDLKNAKKLMIYLSAKKIMY